MNQRDPNTGRFLKRELGYHKKTCPMCGRYLWLRDFAKDSHSPDKHHFRCKECQRTVRREIYQRSEKVPDGLRLTQGRAVIHQGYSSRVYWSEETKRKFREQYPVTPNPQLVIDFGLSESTLIRRAREMGLTKNPDYLRAIQKRGLKAMQRVNHACGNHADLTNFIEAGKAHRFKPGEKHGTPEERSERLRKAWRTRKERMRKELLRKKNDPELQK